MLGWIMGIAIPLFYISGIASAVHALMFSRTAQSATAWILGLVFMPFFTVPLYWAIGRQGYENYSEAQKKFEDKTQNLRDDMSRHMQATASDSASLKETAALTPELTAINRFSELPLTSHNRVKLLIDGAETFDALFAAIDNATNYVLIQFYTVHDDDIGQKLHEHLLEARQRGVAIYFLYDEIGSISLPDEYVQTLRDEQIETAAFSGGRRSFQKFRLNFRNHRKIVVVDGQSAFIGGHNVGDEYLGRSEEMGDWRDTHVRIDGPAVLGLQLSFLRDWYFATERVPENIHTQPVSDAGGHSVQISSSGPNDELKNCGLLFAHLISSACERLWIASPYLVPDGRVLGAIQLACIRGVDVRVLVPRTSDSVLFKFVPYAFVDDIINAGGKVYFYEPGFMHQKVMLVDDKYGVVSTANFDNRSFHLNFEVSCIVYGADFCRDLGTMFENDLERSTQVTMENVNSRPFWHKLATQATRLLAPIL